VLLGAVLQTSFMHPPFGFALFYLRGVAPKEVKSADIYWGAVPWVGLQLLLVAIIIAWPGIVTGFLDGPATGAPAEVESGAPPETGADTRPPTDDAAEIEKLYKSR